MTHSLFCYGTLMFPEIVRVLLGHLPPSGAARLPGHARRAVRGAAYPGIVTMPGAEVAGRLYHGLTPAQLRVLDRYEGAPYRRVVRRVLDVRGRRVTAWVYVIPRRHARVLAAADWDADAFARAGLGRYLRARRAGRFRAAARMDGR